MIASHYSYNKGQPELVPIYLPFKLHLLVYPLSMSVPQPYQASVAHMLSLALGPLHGLFLALPKMPFSLLSLR